MKVKVIHHWLHYISATWDQTHPNFPSVQLKLIKIIISTSSVHSSSLSTPCCCPLFLYTTTPREPPLYPFQASIYINCRLPRTCLATTTWFILHTHTKQWLKLYGKGAKWKPINQKQLGKKQRKREIIARISYSHLDILGMWKKPAYSSWIPCFRTVVVLGERSELVCNWKCQNSSNESLTGEEPCWSRILGDGYGGGIWDGAIQCLFSLPKSMEDLWSFDLR
jgi:hypothetical protein